MAFHLQRHCLRESQHLGQDRKASLLDAKYPHRVQQLGGCFQGRSILSVSSEACHYPFDGVQCSARQGHTLRL